MKLRWKNILLGLSLFFCLLSAVAWGFGIAGKGFGFTSSRIGNFGFGAISYRGGLMLEVVDVTQMWLGSQWGGAGVLTFGLLDIPSVRWERRIFIGLSFDYPEMEKLPSDHYLILPYWLLIVLFAVWPLMRWRERYVERRKKIWLNPK
jgi:hypothetical protein